MLEARAGEQAKVIGAVLDPIPALPAPPRKARRKARRTERETGADVGEPDETGNS